MNPKIRILIAEHDPVDLELLHYELQAGKIIYESEVVQNEQDYINALKNFIPDIILADYTFPSFDGCGAFKIKEKIAPGIPFIIVSGTIGEEKSVELIKTGVTDCVLKDKLFTLITKVERALKEAKERKEKKTAERELAHSESLLAKAQQLAQIGSWELNFTDNTFRPSIEGCRILGLSCGQNSLSSREGLALIHPEDINYVLRTIKESKDSLKDTSYQLRIILKNGNTRHIYSESKFEFDSNGNANGLYGTMQDVTEKVKAEEQLEFEKLDKEALINTTDDMMWSVSHDYKLIAGNKAFVEGIAAVSNVTLKPGDRLLSEDILTPDNLLFWEDAYGKTFSGESFKMEKYTSGTNYWKESWADISFNPIYKDEAIIAIACYSRNITRRKQSEEKFEITYNELQHALNDLNKIMDSSLDVICSVSADGYFLKVSAASEAVWGYKPEELVGKPLINYVYPADQARTIGVAETVMTGAHSHNFENRYVRKDGSLAIIEWSARWDAKDQIRYGVARDVTRKKKLEKEVEIERGRLNDLFLNAPASMGILKGPNHVFEMVNPLYLKLIGQTGIIGKRVSEVLPELDGQGFIGLLDTVYKTGESFIANEMLVQMAHNEKEKVVNKYLNFIYQASRNPDGNIEGIIFFAIDVTEQVLSRKIIEASENRFRAIIEKSIEMITLSDADGKIFYASPSVTKIFGYSLEDISQAVSFNFIHPDDINEFNENRRILLHTEGKSYNSQLRLLHKNGNWIWCEATLTNMLHEPGVNAFVSNFRDITEKKTAEELQGFNANNLYALINNTNDLMWSVDRDFRLITSNVPFDQMCVANFGKAVAKESSVLTPAYSPEMLKHFKTTYERAFAGETFTEIEFFKLPFELWTEISYYPIHKGHEIIGTACHSRDITESKLSEIRLNELNEDLKKYAKKLVISNTELEQFAYVASHDLQEPLRMVTSFLTQLEKKYGNIIDEKGKKYIAFAVDGAKRMRQIILDLLEFSRVGRTEESKESVDLNEMVDEIKILFTKQIEEKKAVIEIGELPVMNGYRVPLHQVFQNLISNALKYTRENISCHIHISAKELPTHWQFAVTDNGIGIAHEYFEKIFVIFQRLHNRDEFSGTGMGLAVTKKVIENMAGKIWVESVEGAGSTFYFTLVKQQ
jgi:PAS domain S-box-containing protein